MQTRLKVLVVDKLIQENATLMRFLSNYQFNVSIAFDGESACRRALMISPDVILIEPNLPGINGFVTCRLLKSNPQTKHVPVIFLSGSEHVKDRIEGLSVGAVDYIVKKTVSDEEIYLRIKLHLDIARRLKALSKKCDDENSSNTNIQLCPNALTIVSFAVAYLTEHIATPPTTESLAKMLGTYARKLNDAFHKVYGMSMYEWLRAERLKKAKQFLDGTGLSIADIGEFLGYSSQANFATAFREYVGMSPRAYRACKRKEQNVVCDSALFIQQMLPHETH